ncbi:glycosyltransferase family 39 protein [Amycolatopsis magusensis]|uniref:Glycosyltransferase RgtA/B/C/D-like domain-containing protein n=1 Tax=Amycolatopsis magusensis TaxID=882444 RepID=A0ABS4PUI3_9PSEU|nr:glycosyltransferase family 39 protein [Amycolatopsis magusensis]MBP2182968.1 hypothetical protein [Amycolatopsis magusensis]
MAAWGRGSALLIAAGTLVLHGICATAYGYHRDEMYFLAESKRLDWAFASEPPFTPLLGRLSTTLFGDSLLGLRLWPALAGAAVVLLTTLIARDLGGGRRAQVVAGLAMGTATVLLSTFHLFGPSAFDQLAWAGCLWILLRLVRGADPRWWLGFGLVAGLGFQNKQTLAMLGLALPVAVLLTRDRRWHAATPWPWLGALLALAIATPVLVWQAAHDWPMLAVSASIREDEGGLMGAALFLPMQVVTMNPLLAPVWLAGLWWLFRTVEFRLFGWLYVVLLVLLMVVGGKHYYLAPMYVVLFAAGGVAAERWSRRRAAAPVAAGLAGLLGLPLALPILPVAAQGNLPITEVNPVLAETIGWPAFVRQVAAVRDTLPPGEPAVVLTSNYGQAGAVELLGGPYRLGQPVSGHNNYWLWGPPPADSVTIIAVGFEDGSELRSRFASVVRAGTIDNGLDVENEEQGSPLWICRGPVRPWAELWPEFRHYEA